ncbi:hypothetical protein MMC25_008039 [Agyrium rufum]|nr:hypothetical protein [Agyrium rufum]
MSSNYSQESPRSASLGFDEDGRERVRCPNPDCGKPIKDLKAHMLTHQAERPEKCPIVNCEYHIKGFARKYDKQRHTLTHYKGMMVCGFCPGSGSSTEKSFNRADVFKRHLTSVHGVEQAPPNSRKKSPSIGSSRKAGTPAGDITGKCSTCSSIFSSAQDLYEHLDECVLRVVQQEEPSEAINEQHLSNIAGDPDVHATLDRHYLPHEPESFALQVPEDEDEEDDVETGDSTQAGHHAEQKSESVLATKTNPRSGKGSFKGPKRDSNTQVAHSRSATLHTGGGSGSVTKPNARKRASGLTFSKGGVNPLIGKGRKKRKHYPISWGMSADKMKMKKRVLCCFDGPRRLLKDEMMLDKDFEVRVKLGVADAYVTDLDVATIRRAEAFHDATVEEKGPWVQEDIEKLML